MCIPHTRCTRILSDDTTMTQDKVTIQEAARTLNIDRRKIYRWIEKGLISKYPEDGKTFVLLEEVQAFCAEHTTESAQERTTHNGRTEISTTEHTHYIVDKEHYEGLLIRLGQLESEKRYLLEYKGGLETKEKELTEARTTINKARNELQRLFEIKQDAETKGKALLDKQAALEAREREMKKLREENERLRLPFWRRIFHREKS